MNASHPSDCIDLLVIGGGVNGVGIARDAAGRGLSVTLCEKNDLASATSSASTKLIHGGLRYLEHYEFAMVRKSLLEREVLLKAAPHIMWPLRFVLPHLPGMRPKWMIRTGLFLYDHLARRAWLPGTETIHLRSHIVGRSLRPELRKAFAYSDGWVDDARLVVLCAVDAAERGATILTRTRCTRLTREDGAWSARLESETGQTSIVRARAVANVAGPWAEQVLRDVVGTKATRSLRLVKGSHIVVRRKPEHAYAYLFQGSDGRVIFAIPYEGEFTLIGTTDVDVADPDEVPTVSPKEVAYLCEQVSRYLVTPVVPAEVAWSFAGVRPLIEDASANASSSASKVSRDYLLDLDTDGPPLMTLWGGKLTTFRKLAEEAVDRLCEALGERRAAWTSGCALPGGDLEAVIGQRTRPDEDFSRFVDVMKGRHADVPPQLVYRLARSYGTRIRKVLRDGLGKAIAPDVYEAELNYLVHHEWAVTGDDILWRRSKLGLHLNATERDAVAHWVKCARSATTV